MEAPGWERTARRRGKFGDRVYVAQGRGQPCTPQCLIVGTVDFPREEYENRRALLPTAATLNQKRKASSALSHTSDYQDMYGIYAPIGDPSCFQAMQGELAIAAVDDEGLTERNILAVDSQLSVTTTVNGWDVNRDAVFAGVVRNARPLSSKDSKGTIAYVGTQTVVNTGPYEILPGDDVYFSLTPHAIVQGNQLVNAVEVDEAGQPGHHGIANAAGDVTPKFRPSTYPVRDTSVYAFMRRAEIIVVDYIKEKEKAAVKTFDKLWIPVLQNAVATQFKQHPKDMPIHRYIDLIIADEIINFIVLVGTNAANEDTLMNVEEMIAAHFDQGAKRRTKYINAIGGRASATKNNFRPYQVANTADEKKQAVLELKRMIAQARLELVCEQHNWLRRHYIGKCIKGNMPGAGIDIACGFGHR